MPRRKCHRKKRISKKLSVALIVFVGACIILGYLVVLQQGRFVSNETMEKYAKTLISDYNQDLGFFLKPTYSYFWFYSNSSYDVRTLTSSSHGAAVWIQQANSLSFEHADFALRVEVGLFGGSVSGHPAAVTVNGGVMFFSYNSVSGAIPLVDNGTLIVEDSQVNSVNYHFVILKGSNETSDWSVDAAKNDSKIVFENDLINALSRSEEVRERYAEPELNTRLQAVISRWRSALQSNGTVTYTRIQKDYDIKQIEELAKTEFGITNSSDFINSALAYLEAIPAPIPTPTKSIFGHAVNDPDNWLYVGLLGSFPVLMYLTYLTFDYLRNKYPSKAFKYLLGIPLAVLGVGFSDLIYGYPYDYSIVSWQSFAIVLIWSGIFWIYLLKKRLSFWFAKKKNGENTKNNPNQKTKKTIESKKP